MSLVPITLVESSSWNTFVDFDIAAFHALVRMLKRTLRQLNESVLAHILMRDLSQLDLVSGRKFIWPIQEDGKRDTVLPSCTVPRICMGVVAKFFLTYYVPPSTSGPSPTVCDIRRAKFQ